MIADVRDTGTGLYQVYYRMTASGLYHISVKILMVDIQRSPVLVTVKPGPIYGPNTIAACGFDNSTQPIDDVTCGLSHGNSFFLSCSTVNMI